MKPESQNLNDYLVSDAIVDWQTPDVRRKALELTRSLSDEIDKARCLYEWVRDAIPHTNDAGLDIVTCTASEVLRHGTGTCFSKSHLLAALLRANGIPAGFCYQVLRLNPPVDNELVLHGLNGVYLASLGKWIRLDARGNTKGVNAQFSIDKEQLAFAMEPSTGELIYDTIFAAPVSNVVDRLNKHASRKELWLDLPKAFEDQNEQGASMNNRADHEMHYYPKESLYLTEDVAGARQWAISLDRTMLTYFEVDPDCRFESHSHESEQITMVLEGVLYFEQGAKVIGVKAGEVIAIPAHAPHTVFTGEAAVKAVDAWSPDMVKYQKVNG